MYFAITVYLIARTIKPTKSREENGPPNHLVALPRIHIHSTHRSHREWRIQYRKQPGYFLVHHKQERRFDIAHRSAVNPSSRQRLLEIIRFFNGPGDIEARWTSAGCGSGVMWATPINDAVTQKPQCGKPKSSCRSCAMDTGARATRRRWTRASLHLARANCLINNNRARARAACDCRRLYSYARNLPAYARSQ